MSPKELCFFVPSNRPGKPWYGLNDIIQAARTSGKGRPDRQKHDAERHVARIAAAAMQEQLWEAPDGRCEVTLTFVEVGRNRDPDNIFGGAKYILDALCEPTFSHLTKSGREVWRHREGCGAIIDDSQRYIELRCAIASDTSRRSPGVWVRIRKKGDGSEEEGPAAQD